MFNSPKFAIIVSVFTVLITALGALAVHGWLIAEDATELDTPPKVVSQTSISAGSRGTQAPPKAGDGRLARVRQIAEPLPAVTEVPVVPAHAAGDKLADQEFVLGVIVGSEARAYCLNMLADPNRELLNDELGGDPIVIAWCDQCQCPRVFSRKIGGKTLTFHLTGETLGTNMLLADKETGSEWSQLPGEAIAGPLKGERLKAIPAVWTDWKTWREKHADTTVFTGDRVVPIYQHLAEYSASSQEREYFARFQWGLAQGEKSRSWPFTQLARHPVVNDVFDGRPIVVMFDRHNSTATAFERKLDGEVLTFRRDRDYIIDEQSHSVWDSITGEAIDGPRRGQRLAAVPGVVALTSNWQAFHPKCETWSAPAAN